MQFLNVEKRDNIEFYLCCNFQRSPFSVCHKTDVTDGMTNELQYAVAPPLGIITRCAYAQGRVKRLSMCMCVCMYMYVSQKHGCLLSYRSKIATK